MVMPDEMAPRAPPAGGLSACRARATACVHRVALGVSHLRWSVVSGFCEPPCSQVMATASPTISRPAASSSRRLSRCAGDARKHVWSLARARSSPVSIPLTLPAAP